MAGIYCSRCKLSDNVCSISLRHILSKYITNIGICVGAGQSYYTILKQQDVITHPWPYSTAAQLNPLGGKGKVNTLKQRQYGRHFADDTFKCIFLNEDIRISFKISLKFVPQGPINNIAALVQIMAWRRLGDKPLSETMLVRIPAHICVTRPQWVN